MINQFIVTFNHLLKMLILNGDIWNFNSLPFFIFDYGKHSSRSQVNAVPRNSSIYAYFILYIISPSNISYSVWMSVQCWYIVGLLPYAVINEDQRIISTRRSNHSVDISRNPVYQKSTFTFAANTILKDKGNLIEITIIITVWFAAFYKYTM